MDAKQAQHYLGFLQDELNAVVLYNALANNEKNPKLAEVYRRMAVVEQHHADEWTSRLQATSVPPQVSHAPLILARKACRRSPGASEYYRDGEQRC
jgi:rubrerythrin